MLIALSLGLSYTPLYEYKENSRLPFREKLSEEL